MKHQHHYSNVFFLWFSFCSTLAVWDPRMALANPSNYDSRQPLIKPEQETILVVSKYHNQPVLIQPGSTFSNWNLPGFTPTHCPLRAPDRCFLSDRSRRHRRRLKRCRCGRLQHGRWEGLWHRDLGRGRHGPTEGKSSEANQPKLVGGIPTPLKNMKVNWDDCSRYMEKQKMFQTTNQKMWVATSTKRVLRHEKSCGHLTWQNQLFFAALSPQATIRRSSRRNMEITSTNWDAIITRMTAMI